MNIVSTGQLRAQSISLQVSDRVLCNGSCKCCISRTTPNTSGKNEDKGLRRIKEKDLEKGLDYAKRLGATHAILTGKAEPTQEPKDYIYGLIHACRNRGFLVDMHTNGYLIKDGHYTLYTLKELKKRGLTMITFSVFSHNPIVHKEITGLDVDFEELLREANQLGLLVRVSLVLTKSGIGTHLEALDFIKWMGNLGVHMVVIRELWIPTPAMFIKNRSMSDTDVYEWNVDNLVKSYEVSNSFDDLAKLRYKDIAWEKYPIHELAPLPWGAKVYAMEGCFEDPEHGVNITFSHCEENDKGPVMKSIVQKPNGHGYRNWDFNANILY